jgi:hypothetical protein
MMGLSWFGGWGGWFVDDFEKERNATALFDLEVKEIPE